MKKGRHSVSWTGLFDFRDTQLRRPPSLSTGSWHSMQSHGSEYGQWCMWRAQRGEEGSRKKPLSLSLSLSLSPQLSLSLSIGAVDLIQHVCIAPGALIVKAAQSCYAHFTRH